MPKGYRGRHAPDVAAAYVANGEHSWPIRL